MVDQVTFPPSIGGSGKTYTNDANPETGVFGGAHRLNFFPMLSDNLAGIGYVSQYAQAIDGAKANADRAENARGYVEAVQSAIEINLLDQFRQKAAIDLDWSQGIYRIDDGTELISTTDPESILNVTRSTVKYIDGPDGILREVPINALARAFDPENGEKKGVLIESNAEILMLQNENLNDAVWSRSRTFIDENSGVAPDGTMSADKLIEDITSGSHYIQQSIGQKNGKWTFDVWLKSAGCRLARLQVVHSNDSAGGDTSSVNLDLISGHIDIGANLITKTKIIKKRNGWCKVSVTVTTSGDATDLVFRVIMRDTSGGITYAGDGERGIYIWRSMAVSGVHAGSSMPTLSTPVTRASDTVSRPLGGEFNGSEFTIFSSFYFDKDALVLGTNPYHPNFSGPNTSRLSLRFSGHDLTGYALQVVDEDGNPQISENLSGGLKDKSINSVAVSVSAKNGIIIAALNGNSMTRNISMIPKLDIMTIGDHTGAGRSNTFFIRDIVANYAAVAAELESLTAQ